jgi:hypothetical protein
MIPKAEDILQSEHPFPWSWDMEYDESIEDLMERAYKSEPVIRDATGRFIMGTIELEDLGPFGRICFAEWLVAQTVPALVDAEPNEL